MSSSSSSQHPSAGRRILSRFASPFSQTGRSIADFHINLDHPQKHYSPGDTVKGHVVVRVVKPVRVTHVSVCLHGFVQVYRTPNGTSEHQRGNSSRMGRGQGQAKTKTKDKGKKAGEYFGNGFASLFEDETVLCGEGRLQEGSYRFDFDLAFPNDMDLPTAIRFERGTVAYMATATLTRPTTIAPVLSCDHSISLVERVDIAPLLPPRPRTITLEPVPKKSRQKGAPKLSMSTSAPTTPRDDFPHTPSVSELSVSSVGDKTISATVQLLKGACLSGESFPVRITVHHSKNIKSSNGVIMTLYRQARVDMHPALPLGPAADGQKRKYEDLYPTSLTGLGGLSLSGAGSSHVFRKDLSQVILPLFVDPVTLTAEINRSILVPPDAFPTITTVPGSMISFRYYVEVVLDIQGKLRYPAHHAADPVYPNQLHNHQPPADDPHERSTHAQEMDSSPFNHLVILDTTPIRRDKSVATCTFEVVVGTVDSDRKKGKAKAKPPSLPPDPNVIDTSQYAQQNMHSYPHPHTNNYNYHPDNPPSDRPSTDHDFYTGDWPNTNHDPQTDDYQWDMGQDYSYDENYWPAYLEPPPIEDEDDLPEKERLIRAEARLMPSQPPGASQSSSGLEQPSVPVLESNYHYYTNSAVAGPSQSSSLPLRTTSQEHVLPAEVPIMSTMVSDTINSRTEATDDKQELKRRELQFAASAPPVAEDGHWESSVDAGPSAPPAVDDEYVEQSPHHASEHLPKYHR